MGKIELANRGRSKATKSTSGQSDIDFLNRSIRLLGAMKQCRSNMTTELEKFRSLRGFRGKKRLKYAVGDEAVTRAEKWLGKMIHEMRAGTWQHYKINYGKLGKRRHGEMKARKKVSSKTIEEKSMCLELVEQLNSRNWEQFLRSQLMKVVHRPWMWGSTLDISTFPSRQSDDGYVFL